MPKPGVLLYFGDMEVIDEMTDEEAGKILRAIISYAKTGTEPIFDSRDLRLAWIPFKIRIDNDSKAYEDKVISSEYATYCREAKRSGIHPLEKKLWLQEVFPYKKRRNKLSDDIDRYQTISNNNTSTSSNINTNSNFNPSSKTTRTRAEATGHGDTPTVEEVKKYCSDRGYTFSVDRFMDKYSKMNWENVDWKDAADGWQRRQREPRQTKAEKRNAQYQKHMKLSDAGKRAVQELLEQEDTE